MVRHAVAAALCVATAALLPTQRTRTPSLLSAKTVWTFEEAREYARSFGFESKDEYIEYRCPGAYALPRDPVAAFGDLFTSWEDYLGLVEVVTRPGFEQVLFVEMGWAPTSTARTLPRRASARLAMLSSSTVFPRSALWFQTDTRG